MSFTLNYFRGKDTDKVTSKRKDSFLLIAQIETKVIERAGTEYLMHSVSTRLQVNNILVLKNDIKCKRNEGGNE